MIVNNGKVEKLNAGDAPGKAEVAGADTILGQL
jgi:hypothetical protein